MRKLICLLISALLVLPAAAETISVDLSSATTEELIIARDLLNEEIEARQKLDAMAIAPGHYNVGVNMPSGKYVVYPKDSSSFGTVAFYARNNDGTEELTGFESVSTQLVFGCIYGDAIELTNAWAIPLDNTGSVDLTSGIISGGGFMVGRHLPAGDYVLSPTTDSLICCYSIQDGPLNTGAEIRIFSYIREPVTVSLTEGTYIHLTDCTIAAAE